MRPIYLQLLRAGAAVSILLSGVARGESASCPQLDYLQELPEIPADPRLVLNADKADFSEGGLATLSGSVRVSQNGREFAAEQLNYNDSDRHVRVDSESLFRDERLVVRSAKADYDIGLGAGTFLDNTYTLRQIAGRGEAKRILIEKGGFAELDQVRFTTCAPGNEAWTLSASKIGLDEETGIGTANNALLRFQHVPIFYLPYFRFPIDGLRHSGFLFPIVGNNNTNGFDLRWPLYLNLGPNYDVTLVPRYLSERGEQIGGQFRYLLHGNEGSLYGEYLPNDQKADGTPRSYLDYRHEGRLSPRFGLDVKYGQVSDRNYFANFGGGVDLTATPYLERGARLTYQAPTIFRVEALVQDYQVLTAPTAGIADPYERLPQIRLDALSKNSYLDTRAGFDAEFTNFARTNSVEGQRFIAQPYLRWERDRAAWYAAAQTDLSYTAYHLTNEAANQPSNPQRTLPLLNAEGGLRFERLTTQGSLQTLEPRLFYLYVPYRKQDSIPLFDSGLPDFDFPQLFARNRYSGNDRISDANQLTSALTSRLIESDSGIVRLSATIGQIYYFRAPRVSLPGFGTPSEGSSDYLANIEYQLSHRWSATATAEVPPGFDRFTRAAVALRYREPGIGGPGRQFDLAYRYRNGLLEQADASFSSPITDAWRAAARLRYSVRDERALESFVGVEYQTCCWALSGTYRRYLTGGNVSRYSNGFFLQLELKGLTRIGNGFERLLPTEEFGGNRRHY
ncbi:MAG: LPS-assembly protein LptD [Nevskia sp.]